MATPADGEALGAQAVRGGLYSVSASLVTLTLGLLRSVLLARWVAPESFGVVALALIFVTLVGRLQSFNLEAAIIHRQQPDARLEGTYLTFRLLTGGLSFGLLAALTPLLARTYPAVAGLGSVLPWLVLAHGVGLLAHVQEAFLRRDLAFRRLAVVDVGSSLAMTAIALPLAWAGTGVWALVAEQASGLGMRCLLTWTSRGRWRPRFAWDALAWRWLWEYGRHGWVVTNLDYWLGQFDDFWTGTALGAVALGLYHKAYDLAHYPRRVLANPLVAVLGPTFARAQAERQTLSRLFARAAGLILRSSYLVAGLLALAIPEFIRYVIGPQWLPMLWPFRLMLLYTALDPLLMLIDQLLLMTGHPVALRRARLWQICFFVPAVILGARLGGISGVALAADGMLLVGLWRLYRPLRALVDLDLSRLALRPTLALTLGLVVGLAVEAWLAAPPLAGLALKLALFASLYGLPLVRAEWPDYRAALAELVPLLRARGPVSDAPRHFDL